MRSLGFVLAGVVLCTVEDAHARCKTTGSVQNPTVSDDVSQIPGPAGPFRYRTASWRRDCDYGEKPGTDSWSGLADERGRMLVPAKYDFVHPITSTRALVEVGSGFSTELRYYEYGRGEVGAAPYAVAGSLEIGPASYLPIARSGKEQISDYAMWADGGEEPMVLTQVREVTPMGNVLQADFQAPDGTDVSRLLDLRGRPVSPVLARITRWAVVPAVAPDPFALPVVHEVKDQVVTSLGAIDHPLVPYDRLYMPIDPDGRPLPLPAGASGVVPLMKDSHYASVYGWVVVFPTADGVELVPTFGTLTEALARAATAERYTGMQLRSREGVMPGTNVIQDLMLVRRKADGLWRLALPWDLEREPTHSLTVATSADADPDVAYDRYVADRAEFRRATIAAEEAEKRRVFELWLAKRAEDWKKIQAAGTLCKYESSLYGLPVEALDQFLRTCPITQPLDSITSEADPTLRAEAQKKYEVYLEKRRAEEAVRRAEEEARLAEEEARLAALPPVAYTAPTVTGGDPWAAGLRAATAAMNASSNAYWSNQNAVYTSNLSAWNSGAQNWCCGGSGYR